MRVLSNFVPPALRAVARIYDGAARLLRRSPRSLLGPGSQVGVPGDKLGQQIDVYVAGLRLPRDDSWKGYRKKRTHVLWDQFFFYEETYGLFKWLAQGGTAAQDVAEFRFSLTLPASDASLGLCASITDSALSLGPGYHLDYAQSLARQWNRRCRAGGCDGSLAEGTHASTASLCLLPGDEILEVNGCTAVEAVESQLVGGANLVVRRPFHLSFEVTATETQPPSPDSAAEDEAAGMWAMCCAHRAKRHKNDF